MKQSRKIQSARHLGKISLEASHLRRENIARKQALRLYGEELSRQETVSAEAIG